MTDDARATGSTSEDRLPSNGDQCARKLACVGLADPPNCSQDVRLAELALEAFRELGRRVVQLSWDGGGLAHRGSNVIWEWRDCYLVDDEVGTYGPFESIEEALALDMFHFAGTPMPELLCDLFIVELPALVSAATDLAGDIGEIVRINDAAFVCLPGPSLKRVPSTAS